MNPETLYVLDGASSAGVLREHLPPGQREHVLDWKDALFDGPVPSGLTLRRLTRLRERHWGEPAGALAARDRKLGEYGRFQRVVLWMGPTVLCQLSLIQLLDWFAGRKDANRVALTLIDDSYAGLYTAGQLGPLLARQRVVTNRHFQLARRAWAAHTSADPRRLGRLVSAGASVFALLPKLRAALLAQVREYPDSVTGLSHMERHLLATVKRLGPGAAVGGVVRETLAWDKAHFGDLLMLGMLRNFTRCSHPLAEFAEPFDGGTVEQFFKARLTITAFGRRVLAGKASHIAANGIDRWLGGVHLQGRDCRWRWDKAAGRIVAAANRRS